MICRLILIEKALETVPMPLFRLFTVIIFLVSSMHYIKAS